MINNNVAEGKKIAIYTRVSTEDQARDGFSLDAQLERLRDFCKTYRHEIIGEYIDDGYSGRNIRRPAYTRMMDDIDKWDAMLVLKMDRIHRNQKNFTAMMENLQELGKDFMSMQEQFDTGTAMGRFVMFIIQQIAQLESEQIGERVGLALVAKAKDATKNFMGHRVPFGYKWDKKKKQFIEIAEQLDIVTKVFDLYCNGTFDPIEINEDGKPRSKVTGNVLTEGGATRERNWYLENGHSFRSIARVLGISSSNVKYYLNNIFYVGYERWCHYFRRIQDLEQLVTVEQWNKAQRKMRKNSRSAKYDPILIPEDYPEVFLLDKDKIKTIPIINRAKHNYNFNVTS